jgi:hypothetical protein
MDFAYSPKVQELRERVTAFMDTYVYPAEAVFERQVAEGDRWQPTAIMEELKAKAKAEGLWNLFLPESELGAGLSNLEYAPLAEIMGRVAARAPSRSTARRRTPAIWKRWCATANEEQKQRWLEPLLRGEIRSAFAMTEPDVASSDATNMAARAVRDGDEWVINGHKWWIVRRRRSALQDPDLDGPERSRCAAPRAALDDPGAGRHARDDNRAPAAGVRLRRRAARPLPKCCSRMCACRLRKRLARRRPRLRDRSGSPWPGPHPPLHALDRRG